MDPFVIEDKCTECGAHGMFDSLSVMLGWETAHDAEHPAIPLVMYERSGDTELLAP